MNPAHRWRTLALKSLTTKRAFLLQQGGFRVLLLLWCPKGAVGKGTACMYRYVPHEGGTAESIMSMQDMVQAPSSEVTPKQLWFVQLHLGARALELFSSSFKKKKKDKI